MRNRDATGLPAPYSPKAMGTTSRGGEKNDFNSPKLPATAVAPNKDGVAMRRHSASGQVSFEWDKEEVRRRESRRTSLVIVSRSGASRSSVLIIQ